MIQVLMGTRGYRRNICLLKGWDRCFSLESSHSVAFGATVGRRMVWVCPWGSRGGAGGQEEEVVRDQSPPPLPLAPPFSLAPTPLFGDTGGVFQQEMPRIINLISL